MYCLPPHTTHIFQPLDVVIFHPLKTHFSRLTQHVKLASLHWKNPINCNKTNFTKLFRESWESLTTSLIKAGFRKRGIVPFERNATDKKRLVNSNCQDSLTDTCINYVSVSSSNNSSLLNTAPVEFSVSFKSSSTPPNPLVAAGIIPATVYNSIIIPAEKKEIQKKPCLNTQARLITSDEQIRQYEEKIEKICKEKEEKEHRKQESQRKKEERLAAAAQRKGLRTRGGKTASLGRGRGIKTRGGKQWRQSTKSLESGLPEEESNVVAANIVTDVTNVTAP